MDEVVAHEFSIWVEIFEFELEEAARRFLFIQQVKRLHLLKHLCFHNLTPNGLCRVAKGTADATQAEELPRAK